MLRCTDTAVAPSPTLADDGCCKQVYVNVVRATLAKQSTTDQAASSTDDATIQVSVPREPVPSVGSVSKRI